MIEGNILRLHKTATRGRATSATTGDGVLPLSPFNVLQTVYVLQASSRQCVTRRLDSGGNSHGELFRGEDGQANTVLYGGPKDRVHLTINFTSRGTIDILFYERARLFGLHGAIIIPLTQSG